VDSFDNTLLAFRKLVNIAPIRLSTPLFYGFLVGGLFIAICRFFNPMLKTYSSIIDLSIPEWLWIIVGQCCVFGVRWLIGIPLISDRKQEQILILEELGAVVN
jgi:hypothetical protein